MRGECGGDSDRVDPSSRRLCPGPRGAGLPRTIRPAAPFVGGGVCGRRDGKPEAAAGGGSGGVRRAPPLEQAAAASDGRRP